MRIVGWGDSCEGGLGGGRPGAWAAEEFGWTAFRSPIARTAIDVPIDSQLAITVGRLKIEY